MPRANYDKSRGAAAIFVAISLLLLLALASLAIDGGLAYDERRDLQNAADNAAYAAAFEDCAPQYNDTTLSNPVKAGRLLAAQNGFDHTDANIDVDVQDLSGNGEWTVTITVSDQETVFGGASPFAADTVTVVASGTATCEPDPFLGGYAVFAGSDVCSQSELDITGSDVFIDGDVHTNEDIKITGSDPVVTGDITYVLPGSAGPLSGETATATSTQQYPLSPTLFDDYRPGGSRAGGSDYYDFTLEGVVDNNAILARNGGETWATGSSTAINIEKSGIYYSPGDITLKGVTLKSGTSITLVAVGTIRVIADGDIVGYDPVDPSVSSSTKIAAFSINQDPPTCAPGPASAVDISAQSFDWEGLIFAPNGHVSFSTSSGTTLDGSIIAYTINLSGSNLSVTYDDDANNDPRYLIRLIR